MWKEQVRLVMRDEDPYLQLLLLSVRSPHLLRWVLNEEEDYNGG